MPATYAHYRFGAEVLKQLPQLLQETIAQHRALFDIGLHGPDVLFYHKPFSANPVKDMGHKAHDLSGHTFFEPMLATLASAKQKQAATSYVCGVLCHYILDSRCHDFVGQAVQLVQKSHTAIETQLERQMMVIDDKDPMQHVVTNHLKATQDDSEVIASFFAPTTAQQIKLALRTMVLYHCFFIKLNPIKTAIVTSVLKCSGDYDELSGLVMTKQADTQCAPAIETLLKLYDEAVQEAPELIVSTLDALSCADNARFARTFNG